MFRTIGKGYTAALVLGSVGYAALGGPVWMWFLFVWIAGAPITLLFTEPSTQARRPEEKAAATRGYRLVSWLAVGPLKTRLGDES